MIHIVGSVTLPMSKSSYQQPMLWMHAFDGDCGSWYCCWWCSNYEWEVNGVPLVVATVVAITSLGRTHITNVDSIQRVCVSFIRN